MPRDLPILFSAPMVLALLREAREPGTGKTQTRRILTRNNTTVCGDSWRGKSCPWEGLRFDEAVARARSPISGAHDAQLAVPFCHPADEPTPSSECGIYPVRPLIEIGDRLWVRETFRLGKGYDGVKPANAPSFATIWYEATKEPSPVLGTPISAAGQKRVAIHMPRWASRLTLTVTDVRVERLQAISEADAVAEGLQAQTAPNGHVTYQVPGLICGQTAVRGYRLLWDTINGDGAWEKDPWIVVLHFEPALQNIDEAAK
jgi:hypothetical protein